MPSSTSSSVRTESNQTDVEGLEWALAGGVCSGVLPWLFLALPGVDGIGGL